MKTVWIIREGNNSERIVACCDTEEVARIILPFEYSLLQPEEWDPDSDDLTFKTGKSWKTLYGVEIFLEEHTLIVA